MKRTLIVSAILGVSVVGALFLVWIFNQLPQPIPGAIHPDQFVLVGDATRRYRIVVPHELPNPAPVVFAFHGLGDSPESMAKYSQLDRLAAEQHCILVYPAATNQMWATQGLAAETIDENHVVQFFDRLLEDISKTHSIDPQRIYLVGMSNGAAFAEVLTTIRSAKIAATAAHSGVKPRGLPAPEFYRPLMLIVGDSDSAYSSVQADAKQFRADGHTVELVAVPGLAHEWSTAQNAVIWNFLEKHRATDPP